MFVGSDFNLFQFHNTVTEPALWILFFGYGIISSLVIDSIGKFFLPFSFGKQILIYILFGYLPFLVFMPVEFALIAGTIGALFSVLFLLGKEKLKPSKWHSWMVFVVPLACLVVIPFDLTSKVGWHEVVGDSSIEVEYDYFNGEHLIPIHGVQGEKIHFMVEHLFSAGKSHGVTVYDGGGDFVGMSEEGNDVFSMEFQEETINYIVIEALDGKRGGFRVKWWNEE